MKPGLSVAALAVLIAIGCNPFSPDQSVILGVAELNAPATVGATSPLDVVLKVELGGCLSFTRIVADRSANAGTLTVWGKDASIGRKDITCTSDLKMELHTYRFDPPFAGKFDITVFRGALSPLMATVQVQ